MTSYHDFTISGIMFFSPSGRTWMAGIWICELLGTSPYRQCWSTGQEFYELDNLLICEVRRVDSPEGHLTTHDRQDLVPVQTFSWQSKSWSASDQLCRFRGVISADIFSIGLESRHHTLASIRQHARLPDGSKNGYLRTGNLCSQCRQLTICQNIKRSFPSRNAKKEKGTTTWA